MTTPTVPAPPSWDLGDLYAGPDDPRLEADLAAVLTLAEAFESEYRGRLARLDDGALAESLGRYATILTRAQPPSTYARLLHAADTSTPRHGALVARVQERTTRLHGHLLFVELELAALPASRLAGLAADPRFQGFQHYVEKLARLQPHQLSELEERILHERETTGRAAFQRLYDEITAAMRFTLYIDGTEQQLSAAALGAYLSHPDRDLRRRAALAFDAGLQQHQRQLVFIHNTLLQDKATEDRLRGYAAPESARLLANELTTELVEALTATTVAAYPLVARYYTLKRRLLGLERLRAWDRAAPLPGAADDVPWDAARRLVVEAYTNFDPEFGTIVDRFFTRRWIDAAPRPGKRGGAFCQANTPNSHAYVLLSYRGKPRDVMTLAHELGHAVHDALAAGQSFLEFRPPLVLRETASMFGEMLVFDALCQQVADPARRLPLLAGKVEDIIAATFFQIALHRYEQRVHRSRSERGELDADAFGAIWQEEVSALYGDSIDFSGAPRTGWSSVRHFVHLPFYLYAYAFGQLLTLALHRLWQADGAAFLPRYRRLLAAGGSAAPRALLAEIGIDLAAPSFWQEGTRAIGDLLAEAEALQAQIEAAS